LREAVVAKVEGARMKILDAADTVRSAGAAVEAPAPAAAPRVGRTLDYLPIGLFGAVMGLTGLSIAWHLARLRFGAPGWIAESLAVAAVLAFLLLSGAYAIKILAAPDVVKAEFAHPIVGNLFGTYLVSLLLLPIVIAPSSLWLARAFWIVGAVAMLFFAWFKVDRWLADRQQLQQATPAWIVPVVGLLDVPLAIPSLALGPMHGVMVLALAVGVFFAVPLFTLIFSRLLFEPPLPDALQPTLMILLAPSAVATSTYFVTTGEIDLFAQSLYALTLFLLLVLVGRFRYLGQCCPFRVSWWAVGFPLAAAAIASLRVAAAFPAWTTDTIAVLLLALATGTILWLAWRTLSGIARGELRKLSS
jgi:tellurite resistance protein